MSIVDDDYDSLMGIMIPSNSTHRYDGHDLEAMILQSDAFDRVLHEYGDEAKILRFEKCTGQSVRDALMTRALCFGRLRLLALIQKWPVPFEKECSPYRFFDIDSWGLDSAALNNWFISKTSGQSLSSLTALFSTIPSCDPWQIIHGHDAVAILSIGLKKVLADTNLSAEKLAGSLRLAYEQAMLSRTHIYGSIKNWEQANPPYQIHCQ